MIAEARLESSRCGTNRSAGATAADSSLPIIQRVESRHDNFRGKLAVASYSNIRKPERVHHVDK